MRQPDPFRIERRLVIPAVAALIVLTGSGGSCSEARHEPTTPAVPEVQAVSLGAPELRLVVLTDLKGYLEPCGCTSRPLGGLDRLAARLHDLRSDGVPTVFVESGDLFFDPERHGIDASMAATQEEWRAQTVAEGLSTIGLAAAAPGAADLREGAGMLAALAGRARFPLLAAGATVDLPPAPDATTPRNPVVRDHVVVDAGALHVGIVGVADWEGVDGVHPPADVQAALAAAVQAARSEGAQVIVALVDGSRRDARRFASAIDGIDVVVSGGLDEDEAHPPSENGAIVVSAGRQGQGVGILELRGIGQSGPWVDVSTWSRTLERDRHVHEAETLRARIAEWERDGTTSQDDLATQRQRLAQIEHDIAASAAAPDAHGRTFEARYAELPHDGPRDGNVRALLEQYDQRVNEHNRVAFADRTPPPVAEGAPHYVGSRRCGDCHAEAYAWWQTTLHGHAYQTLVDAHKEFNLSCVGCHVTGYEQPGGSTVTHLGDEGVLQNVGCENCHGPGSAHSAVPTGDAGGVDAGSVAIRRDAPEEVCQRCHTPEHSDRFTYEGYRRMMMAPGHGLPVAGGAH
jgi:hypothetical protein